MPKLIPKRYDLQISDAIKNALSQKERAIQVIADDVRRRVVLPTCIRYGLTYRTGNGTFAFGDPNQRDYSHPRYSIATPEDAVRARMSPLADVIRMLDTPVDTESRGVLGFYVEDVDVGDLPTQARG